MLLSKALVLVSLIASAGTVQTGGPGGPDWVGLATFVSAIGSLIAGLTAAYVALRKRDSTEEILLKMLQDQKLKDKEEAVPKRRRIGRK